MTHSIPVLIISLYIVVLFAVKFWSQRLTQKNNEGFVGYLLAGRQLPPIVSACLLAGLAIGGASTIGVAERAYTVGISAGWYNAAFAAGALVVGLVAARRYRKMRITTLPELFERHYSATGRIVGVFGQLVIQLVITSLQYVAGGAILSSLLPELFSLETGMVVTTVVFVGITLIGGFWAAGLTNVINVIIIYLGITLGAFLTIDRIGGFGALLSKIPEGHPGFDLFAVGPGLICAWFIVMITQAHSTQSVIQIGFASENEKSASRGYLLGGLIILPVGFIAASIGLSAAVLYPGIVPAEALPRVILSLPDAAAGIILAGLWAADVSTASALLMGSATLVTTDIIKRFIAPDLSSAREKLLCRVAVGVLSVLTLLLALTVSGILKVLLIGLTLTTAYTLIVLMTMFWPAMCRRSSATSTLLATMVSLGAWLLIPEEFHFLPHPIYLTWLVSIVVFFITALVDKRPIKRLEIR